MYWLRWSSSSTVLPDLSDAEITELRDGPAAGSEVAADEPPGLSAATLFEWAAETGIARPRITLAAKSLYGPARWKVADLSDAERETLWAELSR